MGEAVVEAAKGTKVDMAKDAATLELKVAVKRGVRALMSMKIAKHKLHAKWKILFKIKASSTASNKAIMNVQKDYDKQKKQVKVATFEVRRLMRHAQRLYESLYGHRAGPENEREAAAANVKVLKLEKLKVQQKIKLLRGKVEELQTKIKKARKALEAAKKKTRSQKKKTETE